MLMGHLTYLLFDLSMCILVVRTKNTPAQSHANDYFVYIYYICCIRFKRLGVCSICEKAPQKLYYVFLILALLVSICTDNIYIHIHTCKVGYLILLMLIITVFSIFSK